MTLAFAGKEIKKIYLAGKMKDEPNFGHEAFAKAAADLRNQGFDVFNPAETENGDKTRPRPFYMTIDINYILHEADAVVVLSNWKASEGAKTEVRVAHEVGKPVFNYSDLSLVEETASVVVSDYVVR